ncbi:MAG: hypothetical protein NZ518_00745 [Dehalococcoidia bacterium]|nr:hypothetical protein [Dehalococcoidia bacterium]
MAVTSTIERPPTAEELHIHMPNRSYWPVVTALGLVVLASGVIVINDPNVFEGVAGLVVTVIGALILITGMYSWALEPAS